MEGMSGGRAFRGALAGLELARLSSYDRTWCWGCRSGKENQEKARLLAVLLEAARSRPDTLARVVEIGEFAADQPAFELHWSRP